MTGPSCDFCRMVFEAGGGGKNGVAPNESGFTAPVLIMAAGNLLWVVIGGLCMGAWGGPSCCPNGTVNGTEVEAPPAMWNIVSVWKLIGAALGAILSICWMPA